MDTYISLDLVHFVSHSNEIPVVVRRHGAIHLLEEIVLACLREEDVIKGLTSHGSPHKFRKELIEPVSFPYKYVEVRTIKIF